MTAKEIIAAFRSGQMSEEEAVARLTSLYRQKATPGVQAEASSHVDASDIPLNGSGNSQNASAKPASIPLRKQAVDTQVSAPALARGDSVPTKDSASFDIAVIGMSGRFPDAADVEEFWSNLTTGRDSVREVPKSRWDTDKYYDPNPAAPGKTYSKWAGLLEDIEYFDPLFFNISPLEAEFMDPQQRLFLQEAWRAFEDAGYAPSALSGTQCGVFVGVSSGDYQSLLTEAGIDGDAYMLLGNAIAILAGRIGYVLNLKGPSVAIDTASSSSLVAIHHACQSIRTGESEMAIAGGVGILTTAYGHIVNGKAGMLSRNGKCKTFDQSADGFVPGEAVAAIVLKPLHKALKDGDHIYGVIKGSGMNQNGSTNGITAPSAEAQKSLQLRVYRACGIDPSTVTYVECHGTGTKLGDPIEIDALTETFRTYTAEKQFCAIGSAKTNIGHALAACGAVGLIKVLRSLQRKQIPPSLHFKTPNEHIPFSESPFYVNTMLRSWDTSKLPRRAAINSIGFSGTNVHVVLEEYIASDHIEDVPEPFLDEYVAVPISARSEPQLKQYTGKVLKFLEAAWAQPERESSVQTAASRKLRQIAYTLQTGRLAMSHRLVMVVRSWQELKKELQAFVNGDSLAPNTWVGNVTGSKSGLDSSTVTLEPKASEPLNRLLSLAKSWALGHDVDWTSLYPEARPQRISLPTYPFARERYWAPDRRLSAKDNSNKGSELHQAASPVAPTQDSLDFQQLLFLREESKSDETGKGEAAIDWVGEIEKHRGERLLFFYQRDQDLDAITELIRKFEGTLDTPEVFRCSYIKLLEHASFTPAGLPAGVNVIALDDRVQQRRFLQSLEDAQNFPDAFFFLPAQATVAEKENVAEAFFRNVVQKLLLHASGNSIAGYYCYEATGDRSEFQGEALAAEVNSLEFGSANHFYRWIRVPADITELQKAAMLLRERLAYAPGSRGTELVDYSGGKRTVRILEQIKTPEPTAGGSILGSGDTCLITGSLGELGLALCGELSRRYQANMIVAPSAPLSQKETDQLATLRNAGAKIHYLPNPGEDSQSLQKTLARAAGSITQIRGIIDLGPSEEAARRHGDTLDSSNASMGVVEKAWKPKPLVNSNTAKMNGKCVILVNANSVALAEGQFRQAVEGQTLMVGGEDINSANVKIVNWADISSGRKAAQKVLSELGDVDYVLDLSDMYSESRSSDACQYGRIGFFQELIGRYRDLTILYFTRGLQAFQSQWATLAGSRRAGFMKMLSAEYSHVKAKCIDVDSEFLASSLLPLRVISEAMTTLEETEICYRHGKRFVPYLEARKLGGGSDSQHSRLPVRPKGSYVISGGTNGIGLEIASHLAGLGAKNLALLGITPLPPKGQWRSALESNEISAYVRRKLEKLLEIQSLGVNLEIYSGRLIEREKLAGFLSAFRSKAGRIDGVVHSAGCAPDISDGKFAFVNKSQEDLQHVFEPKADGLETLHEALAGDSPDFFVTFSSIAAMVPSFAKGISDYAAANAFADHFVSYQIGQRREYFCSMAWVGWSDVGLHRSEAALPSDGLPERRAASVGLLFNSSRQGIELFEAALSDAGSRSHRLPCLLNESAFQRSSDTLLWARPAILNSMQEAAALDLHSGNVDLGYVLSIDEITQQAPLNFFVLLSQLSSARTAARRQAYRNGFCSAFAAHRNELVTRGKRKGATLALQVGPWKSGSSAASDNSPLERLVPQAALSLIEAALAQGGSSILVSDSRNKDLAYSVAGATLQDELVPSTSKQNSASESPFEQVLKRLKNADRNAREQILLEVNLDRFSDDQIEEFYGLVFENNIRPEAEAAQITSKTANQSSEQSISRQEIKTVIATELKDVLRLNGTTVSERDRFQQYGLDSISGMQLVSRLERVLGLEVPPRWLIDYCTIETLSEKINDTQQLDMAASAK